VRFFQTLARNAETYDLILKITEEKNDCMDEIPKKQNANTVSQEVLLVIAREFKRVIMMNRVFDKKIIINEECFNKTIKEISLKYPTMEILRQAIESQDLTRLVVQKLKKIMQEISCNKSGLNDVDAKLPIQSVLMSKL
jgi:hypothetical protein